MDPQVQQQLMIWGGAFPAGLADIGSDGENLFLPHMMEGRVDVIAQP